MDVLGSLLENACDVSLQASALAFTVYCLSKCPEKMEKLLQVRPAAMHSACSHPPNPAFESLSRPDVLCLSSSMFMHLLLLFIMI
jgi:hypothetical protein